MLKLESYSLKGVKNPDFALPKEFTGEFNLNLLAQAQRIYEETSHIGLSRAQTRSEVNRTTKKVYKQKGTGGARHGSRRAPIYVGGGVAHGPRPLRRVLTLPSRMKAKAKNYALSFKFKNKEAMIISGVSTLKKTKEVADLTKKLSGKTSLKRFTFIFSGENFKGLKSVRNLSNVNGYLFKDINASQIVRGGMLLLDKEIFSTK